MTAYEKILRQARLTGVGRILPVTRMPQASTFI